MLYKYVYYNVVYRPIIIIIVVVVKLFIFVSHVLKHSIQFILAETYDIEPVCGL